MNTKLPQKEIALAFLDLVVSNKVQEAYQRYIGAEFRHHNPYFKGDAESLMKGMEENAVHSPNKVWEVKYAIEEKDTVVIYSLIKQHPEDRGAAVIHIFRFENGKIVELWDVGQEVPADSINENGMF